MNQLENFSEVAAKKAFDKQSKIFDRLYSPNLIIQYKRDRVRNHVLEYVQAGKKMLELNAGTGEDALFFAQKGFYVHATDISEKMQGMLAAKVQEHRLQHFVSNEVCSFTNLSNLKNKGPCDVIFSNFAGLNCTDQLDDVLQSLSPLLNPGGVVILTVLPKFCLWETLSALTGNFKNAFRRFAGSNGAKAHIEGVYFKCWYYSPGFIVKNLQADFRLLKVEGLCSIVPPSCFENFPHKYPRLYKLLMKYENRYKSKWPWKFIGDYYIISLRKNLH